MGETKNSENRLYEWDYALHAQSVARPNYSEFFEILDDKGVCQAADIVRTPQALFEDEGHPNPLRWVVGNVIREGIAWANRPRSASDPTELRIFSDSPNAELLFLSALMTDDAIVMSDSEAHLWSSELPNPIHVSYWSGLLDQMFLCREALIDGRMVVCPALVRRTLGRAGDVEEEYLLDFTNSLAHPNGTFFRSGAGGSDNLLNRAPEQLERCGKSSSDVSPAAVPLLRVDLPIVRGLDVQTLSNILREDESSLSRLRFVLKQLRAVSEEKVPTQTILQDMAERIEHEVAHLHEDYKKLLRTREKVLGNAGLGIVGLVISLSIPVALAPLASALGAAAAGVNSLKYVFAIRDSHVELRRNDYYIAWKAWKNIS